MINQTNSKELLNEIAEMSAHITITEKSLKRTPSFSVNRPGEETGITFAGIPLGHEFNSLVLAILQVSGRAPKEKQSIIDQIKRARRSISFRNLCKSYLSKVS